MGTHPIFESDFDCLTDFFRHGTRKHLVRSQRKEHQRTWLPSMPYHWLPIWTWDTKTSGSLTKERTPKDVASVNAVSLVADLALSVNTALTFLDVLSVKLPQ